MRKYKNYVIAVSAAKQPRTMQGGNVQRRDYHAVDRNDKAGLVVVLSKMVLILVALFLFSFQDSKSLKGTWEFAGGIYNGKKEGAPTDYKLQRKYTDIGYEAFASQKGYKTEKYEAGTYFFKGDTCVDTETFCSQPSKITNIPIHYNYTLKNDTLTLKGTLPTGMRVEEYWRKVK